MKGDGKDGASFGNVRSYSGFDVVDMAEVENRGEVVLAQFSGSESSHHS